MPISEKKIQTIIELYNQGNIISSIEKSENVSRPTIRKILRKAGLRQVYQKDIDNSKTIVSNYFEIIDTEEKAYFLGLLFADGNIYLGNAKRKHYSLSINLVETDKYLLEKLRDCIAPNHKLYFVDKSKNLKHKNQYKFLIDNEKIVRDLNGLGCTQKKSLKLEFPKNIQINLLQHFIRGYFDGDGCICKYTNAAGATVFSCSFTSTNKFVLKLQKIIQSLFSIKCSIYIKKYNGITTDLTISGNQQIYRFMSWLYKDATIYMKRKHDKFLDLENIIKQKEKAPLPRPLSAN